MCSYWLRTWRPIKKTPYVILYWFSFKIIFCMLILCGMVWFGVVWYVVVWCCMVCYAMLYGMMWFAIVWYGITWYGMWYHIEWCGRVLESYCDKLSLLQVVTRVVNRGEARLIKPLSLAAAHCMGEVKLSSETKETEHPYKNDVHKEVYIMFLVFSTCLY